ncbi:MAG: hypothetical protein ACRDT6_23350 [Micromonosporaceae bacterium]
MTHVKADPDPDRGPQTTGPDDETGETPAPGVKPGRVKPRRTASMKVSRTGTPRPAGRPPKATTDAEPEPEPGVPNWAWVDRLCGFLDSPAGAAVLIVTAVAGVVLGPLAIYSLFALAYLGRHRLRRLVDRVPLGPRTTLGLLILLVGLLREVLVWTAEYVQGDRATVLWHSQLGPDLLFNIGVYAAWGIGWVVALTWFRYRLGEVLVMQAVFGLLIENLGQSLIIGVSTLPAGLALLAYTMILSASTVGLAWLLAGDKLRQLTGPGRRNAYRTAAPVIGAMLATLTILSVWPRVLHALDLWPPPGPIRERPFW